MGLHDRTYMKDDQGGGSYGGGGSFGGGMGAGQMPKPTQAVTVLLIANVVMFLLQHVRGVSDHLVLVAGRWWYVWNYITFQFAHGDPWHLICNMLGLYMLGGFLERAWGPKRFVTFYLVCGVFAGICHILMTFAMGGSPLSQLLGASGGVFGIIVACAILFPHIKVVLVLFLVPIRVLALLLLALGGYYMLAGGGGGVAHAAHLGGAVMAAVWVWVLPRIRGAAQEANLRHRQGAWDRKMEQRAAEQSEIDRILGKIKVTGLNSLTRREKDTLQKATRRQQAEEDQARRL